MKTKRWGLAVGFCLLSVVAWAQQPDVGWFQLSNQVKGAYQHKVLGADRQGFYVYQSSGRERAIEKYSYSNQLIYSHKIPLDDRSIEIEELVVRRDDALVFFSIFNPSLRRHGLFYMRVPHQGELGKPTILLDVDDVQLRTRSYFFIRPNDDLSGFTLLHQHERRPDETALEIVFYDARIQRISDTRLILPMINERYELRQSALSGTYDLWLLLHVYDKQKRVTDPERSFYKLIKVNRFTLQAEELKLGSSVHFLNSVQLIYDRAHDKMRLAGFYADKDRGLISGVLLASVLPDSCVFDTIGYSRLDAEFAAKLASYKSAKKEKQLTDYFMGQLILRSDGGVVLLAESNYQTNQTFVQYSQGFPIYREVVYYHYDEIILVSVNNDGTIDWRQIVPKTQISATPSAYLSYLPFTAGAYLHLIFNEEGRSKTNVMLYSINAAGDVFPRTILSTDATDAMILPNDARAISPTTILIPASQRKKKGIFRLTFDAL
jgi:hypothetical protein